MKTVKQILIEARALIALPEHWTQGCFARDKDGQSAAENQTPPYSYDGFGALAYVEGAGGEEHFQAGRALSSSVGGDFVKFNDTHTHAEVLAAFDRAIEAAE